MFCLTPASFQRYRATKDRRAASGQVIKVRSRDPRRGLAAGQRAPAHQIGVQQTRIECECSDELLIIRPIRWSFPILSAVEIICIGPLSGLELPELFRLALTFNLYETPVSLTRTRR